MEMNVKYRLSSVTAVIDDHAVSAGIKFLFCGNGFGNKKKAAYQFTILGADAVNVGDMFFGNNQEVNGRLRIQVLERDDMLVIVND
jgi:hypothetical protein